MKKYILIFLFVPIFLYSYGQQRDSLIKVTDRLYMITGFEANVSFLVTDKGVLVVDAGSLEREGKVIESYIKSVTDKPIKYLVLTHFHYDHTLGACGFSEKPIIIGHKNIVGNLKTFGQGYLDTYRKDNLKPKLKRLKNQMDSLKSINNSKWQDVDKQYISSSEELENANKTFIVYPQITFQDEMTIYLDSDTIRLVYPNSTHTDCNILVEFVNQRVLATGDFLFNHSMPYIDFAANSDTKNWIKQLDYYSKKNYNFIIPGHGKLGDAKDLACQAKYLSDLRNEIQLQIRNKRTLSQIQLEIKMTKYSNYDFQFMLSSEIEAVYNELTRHNKD